MSFGASVAPLALEGDYSTWVFQWKKSYEASECSVNFLVRADETLDKLFYRSNYCARKEFSVRKLSDGTLESVTEVLHVGEGVYSVGWSVLRKYFAYVVDEGGVPKLKIFKDGTLIHTLDLSQAPISWTNVVATADVYVLTFSPNGRYIFIDNIDDEEYALFEGS